MMRGCRLCAGIALFAGLASAAAPAAAAPNAQEHASMLIDKIHSEMWPGQRDVKPGDYPKEQASFRADVAHYLKGRFRLTGDRLFVIPPDGHAVLLGSMFQLAGPSQLTDIDSEPALDQRPYVVVPPDAATGAKFSRTVLTVGKTMSGEPIYTVVGMHVVPDTRDRLIGYFQLEPLVADPAKGL